MKHSNTRGFLIIQLGWITEQVWEISKGQKQSLQNAEELGPSFPEFCHRTHSLNKSCDRKYDLWPTGRIPCRVSIQCFSRGCSLRPLPPDTCQVPDTQKESKWLHKPFFSSFFLSVERIRNHWAFEATAGYWPKMVWLTQLFHLTGIKSFAHSAETTLPTMNFDLPRSVICSKICSYTLGRWQWTVASHQTGGHEGNSCALQCAVLLWGSVVRWIKCIFDSPYSQAMMDFAGDITSL